jgi:glutamate synthase (NADPH/NADH) small chain
MDCGTPFCNSGCPVNNIIPDFNDLVYRAGLAERLRGAGLDQQLPRVHRPHLPAPCEAACTLNVNDDPVGIKSIEHAIIDRAWERAGCSRAAAHQDRQEGGGGRLRPAGMAAAQQLARAGHDVTLFEKNDRIGGLLRYGIPDFKMEKAHIDRRVEQMQAEGVTFRTGVHGRRAARRAPRSPTGPRKRSRPSSCRSEFDAVLLTGGAEQSRDLPVPGRDLDGIHFAMDFLPQAEQGERRRQGEGPDPRRRAST